MTDTILPDAYISSLLSAPCLPEDPTLAQMWCEEADKILPDSADKACQARLAAIIMASPHLHHLAKKFPADITPALAGQVHEIMAKAQQTFTTHLTDHTHNDDIMASVRLYRYRCYFALALAELNGAISSASQAPLLSECAETALRYVLAWLCKKHTLPETAITILALGKLGAKELNYSSDIDLIILFDDGDERLTQERVVKLSRDLCQILQTQTKDGFGWRVDLRLRPDPGATAIALSYDAAVIYYESIARSWERLVFIRARPVAGNVTLGQEFLDAISPFIWRRQRDYSILEDMVTWVTHVPLSQDGLHFDVKKGAYGIRHIEMMTHLLQLLYGGRDTALRSPQTDAALQSLAKAGYLTPEQAQACCDLYWQWRAVEHRLQYCRDAHIYHMPNSQEDMDIFARFAGFETSNALVQGLRSWQERTKHSANHPIIMDLISAHKGAIASGAWPSDEESQQAFLTAFGFQRPQDISRIIASWMSGRHPATRSERARQHLSALLPLVVKELAKGPDIDAHFIGFARFVESLPAGVQVFSLLSQHPKLIQLLSNIANSSSVLMHKLAKHPVIFEQMLDDKFFEPLQRHPDFQAELATEIKGKNTEDQLDAIRQYANEAKFRAEMHIITYPEDALSAGAYLSALSDACLLTCLSVTKAAFEAQYGTIPNSEFAIVLLGRAGTRQMTPASDIDVIFLYDGDRASHSDGPKSLSCAHYYQRFAQRLISWITAKTSAGSLCDIDTRLRPDGNAGPLATHFDGWGTYLAQNAWSFEKLALTKARLLQPQGAFAARITQTLRHVTNNGIDDQALAKEISLLRKKVNQQELHKWSFKKRAGGLLDCDFLSALHFDCADQQQKLHHLTMIAAVMMAKADRIQDPPLPFQSALCLIMQKADFKSADVAFEEMMAETSRQLHNLLTRLDSRA